MQLGTPRRVSGFTPAQVNAISQGLGLVGRLGGVAYAPHLSMATVNSDGSGGVTQPGGLVGMVPDISWGFGLAGPDLLTGRGNFSNPADWNTGAEWVIAGNSATHSGAARQLFPTAAVALGPGSYLLSVNAVVSAAGSGVLFQLAGGASSPVNLQTGTFDLSWVVDAPTATTNVVLTALAGWEGVVRNFRVFRLAIGTTSAATQSTTANKPTLGPGALPGFGSMVFDGADWLETSALAATNTEAVYCAVRPSAGAVADFAGRGNTAEAGQFGFRRAADNSALFFTYNGSGYGIVNSAPGTLANGTLAVLCGVKSPSRTYLRLNGIEVGSQTIASAANPASRALQIGRSLDGQNFVGLHAFAAWVPTEPTAAQHAILENCARAFAGMPLL